MAGLNPGSSVNGVNTYTGPKGGMAIANPIVTRPVADQANRDFEYNQGAASKAAAGAADLQQKTGAQWNVDQYGNTSYQSGVAPVSFDKLSGALSSIGGTAGAPGSGPPPPTFIPANMPQRGDAPDGSMADSAAFARAKDRTGQTARASMNALRDTMGERGIQGSGIESKLTGDIIGRAQGQLGDFDREAMIRDFDRSNAMSDAEYQAAVDMSNRNASGANVVNDANANRAVTMRGQDVNAGNQRVQSLQTLAQLRNMGVVY